MILYLLPVILQLISIFDGTNGVPIHTSCPADEPVPDTLGGCISCSDCRNLKSKAPAGCQVLCDTLSTTTDDIASTPSLSVSTLIESTTDTVSRGGYAYGLELGLVAVIVVVVIISIWALVYFCFIKPKQDEQPCPPRGCQRRQTCVEFNAAKNKATIKLTAGKDNDAANDIGDDEKDGMAADQFQPPQSPSEDLPETRVVHDNFDVEREISCSSHTRGNHPIHGPNQICEKDDHKAEFAPTHTNGVKFHK